MKRKYNSKFVLMLSAAAVGALIGAALAFASARNHSLDRHAEPLPEVSAIHAARPSVALAIPSEPTITTPPALDQEQPTPAPSSVRTDDTTWLPIEVHPGDSLARIFKRQGIADQVQTVVSAGPEAGRLSRIRPGEQIRLSIRDGKLYGLEYDIDNTHRLKVERSGEEMVSSIEQCPFETRTQTSSGIVRDSLFSAGKQAGLSDRIIMKMVAIFAWDVDFALDIRQGDSFTVVYEQYYRDGKMMGEGEIRAAEFVNQGKSHRAFRFTTADGRTDYFSPDGRSLKKQFTRTPVSIARISSRFNLRRKHPVLNRVRAHKGVDYAAPTGTPIKATGDGKVVHVGRKGGYGRTVILKHGSSYTTLYAHMSRYARGIKPGKYVRQGQTIGYIGKSGLATGPHLHYEFRVNGKHRNPLTVTFPQAQALPARDSENFVQQTAELNRTLDEQQRATVALAMAVK